MCPGELIGGAYDASSTDHRNTFKKLFLQKKILYFLNNAEIQRDNMHIIGENENEKVYHFTSTVQRTRQKKLKS